MLVSRGVREAVVAPCRNACPAGIDVPRYLRYIRAGQFKEALGVILERIPFPHVCGYSCLHPCEAACARRQLDQPVAIRELKRVAAEAAGDFWPRAERKAPSGKSVAVVGSGPCGLTAAYYLAQKGHEVSVFEARPEPGGMMRYAIPDYRLPKEVLTKEIDRIRAAGVLIKTGAKVETPDRLIAEGYNAVLLACGAWRPTRPEVEGLESPTVAAHSLDGLAFLEKVNSGEAVELGRRVLVVGGGNAAVDSARSALRLGAREVTIVYRRSRPEMPAAEDEVEAALYEGVKIRFLAVPVRVLAKDGASRELICQAVKLGPAKDSRGRPQPLPIEGSEFSLPFDTLIFATGHAPEVPPAWGLTRQPGGLVAADEETLATNREGVFAGGDMVSGPASIIQAIAQGRRAASSIDRFLGGDGSIDEVLVPDEGVSEDLTPSPRGRSRPYLACTPLSRRLDSFSRVELGYDGDAAKRESRRCLSCDLRRFSVEVDTAACKGCQYCAEVCKLEVFAPATFYNERGYRPLVAAAPERCIGCLDCFYACPDFAIQVGRCREEE